MEEWIDDEVLSCGIWVDTWGEREAMRMVEETRTVLPVVTRAMDKADISGEDITKPIQMGLERVDSVKANIADAAARDTELDLIKAYLSNLDWPPWAHLDDKSFSTLSSTNLKARKWRHHEEKNQNIADTRHLGIVSSDVSIS